MNVTSWIHPSAEKGQKSGLSGKGLFAKQDILAGTIISIKRGHLIDKQTLQEKADIIQGAECQIGDDRYLAPLTDDELGKSMIYVNHSCNPNLGMFGKISTITMRDVKAGEELTIDYAMFLSDTFQEFDCSCGAADCRGKFTNEDWKNPDLQQKYKGYFATYLQHKIDQC